MMFLRGDGPGREHPEPPTESDATGNGHVVFAVEFAAGQLVRRRINPAQWAKLHTLGAVERVVAQADADGIPWLLGDTVIADPSPAPEPAPPPPVVIPPVAGFPTVPRLPSTLSTPDIGLLTPGTRITIDGARLPGIWGQGGHSTLRVRRSLIEGNEDLLRPHGPGNDWLIEDSVMRWVHPLNDDHKDMVQALSTPGFEGGGPIVLRRMLFDTGTEIPEGKITSIFNSEWWDDPIVVEDSIFRGAVGPYQIAWEVNDDTPAYEVILRRCIVPASWVKHSGGRVRYESCWDETRQPIADQTL